MAPVTLSASDPTVVGFFALIFSCILLPVIQHGIEYLERRVGLSEDSASL
uniref:Uncharacterized protein n=1 Tax=uncultured prokaryote TaxID=198431 RepID=A0A0H5Q268_9ZZZZ|nr:hypothetical protein [uncultured prokaryote]